MKTAVIAIAIIILAVAIYAAFAKTQIISNTTSTQESHKGALGFLQGILDGFSVSVIGK